MNRTFPWGHIAALAIWVAIFGAIYLYFDAREKPTISFAANMDLARGEIKIPRSRDGHYYVSGAINGHPITFMVDTGASTVSIDKSIARSAGLPPGAPVRFVTAGGAVMGEMIAGQTIAAGGIEVEGISVAVGIQGNMALLGQNFLRKVEVTQSDDVMTLRIKPN